MPPPPGRTPILFSLPRTATAPFCPSEVRGTILVSDAAPWWTRLARMVGPGLLVSVGYMDPGNWATDIGAGSQYGYALLWVVAFSSLAAMLLQTLSLRLGLAARKDLARACRERYRPAVSHALWLMAEVAIVACDVAEVLGSALALHLLLGVTLLAGIAFTALYTVIVLGLQGKGFRQVEAIILGLVSTMGLCFAAELLLVGPDARALLAGLVPHPAMLADPAALVLVIGILGATVMPHNLYLHSSIVQTRLVGPSPRSRAAAISLSTLDTVASLGLALLVNAALLVLAAAAFHAHGHAQVTEIQDAYHLLDPLLGGTMASLLFGIALLASGQSSTFTGTIAGQVVLEGFLQLKIPCWQRRVITRVLALVPAFWGVWWLGDAGVGRLLVGSQVVLSLQLPFAMWPLIRCTSDPALMGDLANGPWLRTGAWTLFVLIATANLWLLATMIA